MIVDRILIVAPSWIGDAILSEPLVALLRDPLEEPVVDVLAPAWVAPVYERMRGIRSIIESTTVHGRFDWNTRRALARTIARNSYSRALVLPNSWKSALIPWLAKIPQRTGYAGEARFGLINDLRRLDKKNVPRLVDRFAALAGKPNDLVPMPPRPVLVPNAANRAAAVHALDLRMEPNIAILCPGAEFGPAKRWPPTHFAALAARFLADGMQVWIVGSPNDKLAAESVVQAAGESGTLPARPHRPHRSRHRDRPPVAGIGGRQQRFRADARGGRRGPAHGGAVRIVVAALHAAAVATREDRADRHRVQPVLQAGVPAGPFQVHARPRAALGV